MFSSENVPEHLCLSVTQADREMDSHASSYTNRHRHELARSPRQPLWPAHSSRERGPCGHWEPRQLPLPLLLWEAKTESQFAQQHRHLTQPNCQLIKAAHCPTDRGFPCLPRGACCSCCARSAASSPALARSAGVRVKIDSQGRSWRDHREVGSAWPPTALSRGEFC